MHPLRSFPPVLLGILSGMLAVALRAADPAPVAAPAPGPTPTPPVHHAAVTPDVLPEAQALLDLLQDLSGRHTLTGQHNYPATRDRNSQFATRYTGRPPAVWSCDLGHAKAGDTDSYLARPTIVAEAIRQHRQGALVTLCWHAVPPTTDEPGTFRPLPDADPNRLASVQGQLLDQQFADVLTPGTPLYENWCRQVDAIAVFLKMLEHARVPVLWRPYHEMNGAWFWWGGRRTEPYSTRALYRQLFDRLVHHHGLKNLIWLWSVDRVSRPEGMAHADYFPGLDTVDVLCLDVYGNDFAPSYYDSLVALADGKPLALAEVGNPPAPEILAAQPRWTFYAVWAGMVRNTTPKTYAKLFRDPRILNLDAPAYAEVTAAYRTVTGLPRLEPNVTPADFSGVWSLNPDASEPGRNGLSSEPAEIELKSDGPAITRRQTRVSEFGEDQVTDDELRPDGTDHAVQGPMQLTGTQRVERSADGRDLVIQARFDNPWGPPGSQLDVTETWELIGGGRQLAIWRRNSLQPGAEALLVYDRLDRTPLRPANTTTALLP